MVGIYQGQILAVYLSFFQYVTSCFLMGFIALLRLNFILGGLCLIFNHVVACCCIYYSSLIWVVNMVNITKVYTKKGDDGSTRLAGNHHVRKDSSAFSRIMPPAKYKGR